MQRFDFANGGMKNPMVSHDFFKNSNLAIIYKDLYLTFLEFEQIKSYQSYQRIVTVLSYEDFKDVNKICDLGDVFILTWKK